MYTSAYRPAPMTDPDRDLDTLYRRLAKARRIGDKVAVINLEVEIRKFETLQAIR